MASATIIRVLAGPKCFTGLLIQCDDCRSGSAWCANDFVAIDKNRFAVAPAIRFLSVEVLLKVLSPIDFSMAALHLTDAEGNATLGPNFHYPSRPER